MACFIHVERSTFSQIKVSFFSNLTSVNFGFLASEIKHKKETYFCIPSMIKGGCIHQVFVFFFCSSCSSSLGPLVFIIWAIYVDLMTSFPELLSGNHTHQCTFSSTNCDENKDFFHMPLRILVQHMYTASIVRSLFK